jgi:hypothetical protein
MEFNVKYLSELEKTIYQPLKDYTQERRINNITSKQRFIMVDWMYTVNKIFKNQFETLNLAITIMDAYFSLTDEPQHNWQGIGCMCLDIASFIAQIYRTDISDYIYITDGAYDRIQFITMRLDIIKFLNGQFIRPTTYYFLYKWLVSTNDENLTNALIFLSLSISSLMTYKPTSIANALYFLLTGETHRTMTSEVTFICKKLWDLDLTAINDKIKPILIKFKEQIQNRQCPIFTLVKSPSKTVNKVNISFGTPILQDKIGEGVFAKVFKYNKIHAVKFYKFGDDDENVNIINEIATLTLLSTTTKKHCQVISFEGLKTYNKKEEIGVFLFYELAPMNLYEYRKSIHYNSDDIITMFKQIVEGIVCCHYNDLIHGDLKPENIVWFSDNKPLKIIDFGSSIALASFKKGRSPDVSTPTYRAPEVFLFDKNYGYKIDMWSIGLILYYMVTNEVFFHSTIFETVEPITLDTVASTLFQIFGVPNDQTWPGVTQLPDWQKEYDNLKLDHKMHNLMVRNFGEYYNLAEPCLRVVPSKRITSKKLLKRINKVFTI